MIDLLKKKLNALQSLKNYTKDILTLSAKFDDEKISSMIAERQKFMDDIDLINVEIDKCIDANKDSYVETDEVRFVKHEIIETIRDIMNMDKVIRKGVNDELINVKNQLNHPETATKSLNVKI